MKRVFRAAALLFSVCWLSASAAAAEADPYGVWLRAESGTEFDFYNCANKLCARIVKLAASDDQSAMGTVILRNAVKKGDEWRGDIFNIENGKIYKGAVSFPRSGELKLEGCLLRVLCKSEIWKRAPDQTLASTPGGQPAKPAPAATPGPGR